MIRKIAVALLASSTLCSGVAQAQRVLGGPDITAALGYTPQDASARKQPNGYAGLGPDGSIGAQVSKSTAGSVFRGQSARSNDIKNPRDFGAICDGTSRPLSSVATIATTSALNGTITAGWTLAQWQSVFPHATDLAQELDGAAIQETAYALSPLTGGWLWLPQGCLANRTIHVVRPYTTIGGGGGFAGSVYTYPSHNFNVFSNDAPYVSYANFGINPGGVGGPGGGTAVAAPSGSTEYFGIYDPYVAQATPVYGAAANYRMTVRNVDMQAVFSGILSGGGDDVIDQVHLRQGTSPLGSGVVWDTPYVDARQLWNSGISGFNTGYRALGAAASIDVQNTELNGNNYCAYHVPAAGLSIVGVYWTHVFCDSSHGAGGGAFFDARAAGSKIARISIQASWLGGNTLGSGAVFFGAIRGVNIGSGTQIYLNQGDGITIDSSVGTTLGFDMANLSIAQNGSAGIGIGSNVIGFSITNCSIGPNADFGPNGYGYYIAGGTTDYYRIIGNDTHGNTNANVNGASGAAHQAVANNL